jgi:membrane-associated phospholipid phosphatase
MTSAQKNISDTKKTLPAKVQRLKLFIFLSAFPLIIFLVILCVTLWLNQGELSRAGYWQMQRPWFISINHALSAYSNLFYNLTYLGDGFIVVLILSFLIIIRPQAWIALFATIPVAFLSSYLGKNLLAIPRPASALKHSLFNMVGEPLIGLNSLPSGHAITIVAAMVSVLFVFLKKATSPQRWFWIIATFMLASVLCLSRIVVCAHWPLDLLAWAAFGYIAGISGAVLTQNKTCWLWMTTPKGQLLLATLLLLWSAFLLQQIASVQISQLVIIWLAPFCGIVVSFILIAKIFMFYKAK